MKYTVLTIAGSDSGCGAGVQADLKTIQMHDLWGVCVITNITAQNTKEIRKIYRLPLDIIESQFDVLFDDFNIKSIKIGMLHSVEIAELISKKIEGLKIPIVLDPIIKSSTGTLLIENNFLDVLIHKLIPLTTIITPNIKEAEQLSGLNITNQQEIEEACKKIVQYGTKAVIIKGGHLNEDLPFVFDTLYYNKKFYYFKKRRVKKRFHGLGCTFSSSIACNLIKHFDLIEAVKNSEKFMEKVISNSIKITSGLIPVNQKII